jgi:XTP/dITP diphosphohydrolase
MTRRLLVASRSTGKIAEIRRILSEVPDLELLDLDEAGIPPSPDEAALEPYDTFEENARSKAEHFHRISGLPTVADDSGIEVDALGGAPGVRSKRFAPGGAEAFPGAGGQDAANNAYLVERLKDVPARSRTARYVCVAVLLDGAGPPWVARGEAEGVIVDEPRGRGGFGYDPHVLVPELDRTFAELSAAEKDERSHRGAAFRALAGTLRAGWGSTGARSGSSGGAPTP